MCRVKFIKVNIKLLIIREMIATYFLHHFFGCCISFFCGEHDGGAMRIGAANVITRVAAQALKTRPNVGLYRFDQMPQMNFTVGIGQGRSDENVALLHNHPSYLFIIICATISGLCEQRHFPFQVFNTSSPLRRAKVALANQRRQLI
ncbi:MAG: hypothetical protein ACD_42C00383G0001 [uncultured bacterium]|nr:MAG: hypothetical protein ACD_42C00383G0001 [uncultured bacterium]